MPDFLSMWRAAIAEKYVPKGCRLCDIGCGKKYYFLKKISKKISSGAG